MPETANTRARRTSQVLSAVLLFCVVTRPSTDPHGLTAGVAVMMAVAAIACQYALLRLALPQVVSTAVMAGNLTNAVLGLMESSSQRRRSRSPMRNG